MRAGIHDQDDTQIAPKMGVIEDLMVEHDGVVIAWQPLKTRQVVEVDLAVIRPGPSESWTPWSLIEIAQACPRENGDWRHGAPPFC